MYYIWHKAYYDGKYIGAGVSCKSYRTKGRAELAAKKQFTPRGGLKFIWQVSETDPFVEWQNKEISK